MDGIEESLIPQLLELYRGTSWASERTAAEVRKMLINSDLVVAVVDDDGALVAFARVLTDFVFFAMIFDVVVSPTTRGTGLGRSLLTELAEHPQLQEVASLELVCQPELTGFYERFGFSADVGRSLLMRRAPACDRYRHAPLPSDPATHR